MADDPKPNPAADEQFSEEDAQRRFEAALKAGLSTPPKPKPPVAPTTESDVGKR